MGDRQLTVIKLGSDKKHIGVMAFCSKCPAKWWSQRQWHVYKSWLNYPFLSVSYLSAIMCNTRCLCMASIQGKARKFQTKTLAAIIFVHGLAEHIGRAQEPSIDKRPPVFILGPGRVKSHAPLCLRILLLSVSQARFNKIRWKHCQHLNKDETKEQWQIKEELTESKTAEWIVWTPCFFYNKGIVSKAKIHHDKTKRKVISSIASLECCSSSSWRCSCLEKLESSATPSANTDLEYSSRRQQTQHQENAWYHLGMRFNDIHVYMEVGSSKCSPTNNRGIRMEIVNETAAPHVLGCCDSWAYAGVECKTVVYSWKNCRQLQLKER